MDQKRRSTKRYGNKPFKKGRGGGGRGRYNTKLVESEAAEDLAEYILKVLAREPDSLHFERKNFGPRKCRLSVKCDPSVTGRLIGKDGRTISALRSLIKAASGRYGKRVDIVVS